MQLWENRYNVIGSKEVGKKPPTKGYASPLEAGQGKETDSPLKPPEVDLALPTP